MKTPEEELAEKFNEIFKRCDDNGRPTGLSFADRAIYYIVAVRCEMDANGFGAVFEQLLDYEELVFLIDALEKVSEVELANYFRKVQRLLESISFFDSEDNYIDDYPPRVIVEFDQIENEIRRDDQMWQFDAKLLQLKNGG